jgi:hypothetical protein
MLAKLRARLTYANVVSTICLCLVVGGGSAYAANTIFSTDIVDGEVKTADLANLAVTNGKLATSAVTSSKLVDGQVLTGDLAGGAVTSAKIADGGVGTLDVGTNALTGADIQESTLAGVKDGDSCGSFGALLGRICASSDGVNREFFAAMDFCASREMRIPTWGEAHTLALNHDVPGVTLAPFWTDTALDMPSPEPVDLRVIVVDENGGRTVGGGAESWETVCVANPD